MKVIIWCIILFLSLILGSFGFSQIIGTIKYIKNFKFGSAVFTVVFWEIILACGVFAVIFWLDKYIIAVCIGYGISFVLSLGTKPDSPFQSNNMKIDDTKIKNVIFISDDEANIDTSFMTEDDKKDIENINKAISTMIDTYNKGVNDLGNYTIEDAENAYKYGFMSENRYDELKNSVEMLTIMKETYPTLIDEMKEKRREILKKYE